MAKAPRPKYRINLRPYRILYFPVLVPVALLLALFNKISPIPFKIYNLRVERIGQMAGNQEEIICELELGELPREFRVFVHKDHPSNAVLQRMQERALPFRQAFLPLFDVCHKFGGLGVSSSDLHDITGRDPKQLIPKTKQHIDFTAEEEEKARQECRDAGIDPNRPFVSVLGRDPSYLQHVGEPTNDDSYRNVDINTFIPALEYLAGTQQVVRLGSVVRQKLNTGHPDIIDYSNSGKRTELLDVYLSARCRFFFSVGTGLDSIAACCFRLPVLYVDYIPFNYACQLKPNAIFIPKKFWHIEEKRYLTFTEILTSDVKDLYTPSTLNPLGIAVHDNTPEEILDAAREMDQRLAGTWQETDEDRDRQQRFWALYRKHTTDFPCEARIGTAFLRDNPEWLE